MLSNWPQQDPVFQFPEECERMESLMEIVRSIRNPARRDESATGAA